MSASKYLQSKARVMDMLHNHPVTRDSDSRLVANVWRLELSFNQIDVKQISGFELLKIIAEGDKISPIESITRARRKLQEEDEGLRGKKYKKRHGYAEKIKEELRT